MVLAYRAAFETKNYANTPNFGEIYCLMFKHRGIESFYLSKKVRYLQKRISFAFIFY